MIWHHYLQLFYYYRKLILWIVGGITGTVAALSAFLLFVFPFYTATAAVVVMPTEAEFAYLREFASVGGEGANPAEMLPGTYIEYLISKPVAELVFDKVAAQMEPAPQPEGWRSVVSEAARETIGFLWMIYNTLNSGKFVEPTPREQAIAKLIKGINIETVETSYVLQIEVTLPLNAQASALAANALAEAYIERVSDQSAQTAEALISYLAIEIADRMELRSQLQQREFAMRKDAGILVLEQERDALLSTRDAEQERLLEIRIEREELEARLAAYQEDRAELRRRGTLALVEQEIALSDAHLGALQRREALRLQSIERINRDLAALNERDNPLAEIQSEIKRMNEEIQDLRDRQVAQNLSKTQNLRQLRVVSPAVVPEYASFPEVVVNTVAAFIASIFIVVFSMVAIDTLSGSVKTTVDLRRLVGNRGLGRIPRYVTKLLSKGERPGDSAKLRTALRRAGRELEARMAAIGLFDSPSFLVTGFGSSEFVSLATLGLAGTLVAQGATVNLNLSENCEAPDPDLLSRMGVGEVSGAKTSGDSSDKVAAPEAGQPPVLIECIGPVSRGFSWSKIVEKSAAVICVLPDGQLTEEELLDFRDNAEKRGVPEMAFLIVPS